MRSIRTTMAAMLMIFALSAIQLDTQAQTRRSTTTSTSRSTAGRSTSSKSTSSKSTVSRSTSSKSTAARPVSASRSSSTNKTTSVSRSSSNKSTTVGKSTAVRTPSVSRSTSTKKTATASQAAPSRTVAPSRQTAKPSITVAPNRPTSTESPERNKVTRPVPQPQTPQTKPAAKPNPKPNVAPPAHGPHGPKPVPPRIHPRDRDFMHYDAPSRYWTGHNHCYGHRIKVIPSYAVRHVYHGVTYYCYDDIWYRPYSGYYVVCRPPFGTVLAANIIADMTWTAVKLSYYNTVFNTYSQINENNEYIAQQNAVIAQNNATIAAQNAQIAAGQLMAQQAYTVANNLGLVQSYADASANYFYQDGVFYVADKNGQYRVIVPPAGAYVETIPEDYDLVTLADGKEYYKVDDTVYRITIVEGKPLFEVLGQLYNR